MQPECFTSVGSLSRFEAIRDVSIAYVTEGDIESHLWSNQVVLKELINYVESIEYDCECGLAGSLSTLKHYLDDSPKVKELTLLCRDRTVAVFILGHMLDITTRRIDPQYRNPWEMAVLTYLHALTQSRTDLTIAASTVARRLMNAFWIEKYISTYIS